MTQELTVKEYAARERVTERTVRRWIDKGAVDVRRTPGGGLRITSPGVVFLSGNATYSDISGHPSKQTL